MTPVEPPGTVVDVQALNSLGGLMSEVRNVALVHGGFVDGSGGQGVYHLLKNDGYSVSVAQTPTLSLEEDVAVTRRALDALDGPTILVGHSYGGAVITAAGPHENAARPPHHLPPRPA